MLFCSLIVVMDLVLVDKREVRISEKITKPFHSTDEMSRLRALGLFVCACLMFRKIRKRNVLRCLSQTICSFSSTECLPYHGNVIGLSEEDLRSRIIFIPCH